MKISTISRTAILCCGISALALPAVAQAQDAQGADEVTREIIVTATRDTRTLREVPMTVNVATGEDIQKLKIFDVKDISQLAPGLELTNTTGRNNSTSLRGQSFDPDQGTAPAIQVYYNEVPADAQTVYTAIYDIGQIEVLRGPQGLLRGLTAPAGAITITTKRPSFDFAEGYAQATATDRHGYNMQGGVSVPISDKFAIRVAGLVDGNRLNQVRNVTRGGEYSRSRTESARITLGVHPSDAFTAYLTYQYTNARSNQFQQVIGAGNTPQRIYSEVFGTPKIFVPVEFGGGPFAIDTATRSGPPLTVGDYASVSDGIYRTTNKSNLWSLHVNWDLGPATLTFVGGHQFSRVSTTRDTDTANSIPGYEQGNYASTTYPILTQELLLRSNNEEGFGWSLGFFHTTQDGRAINTVENDLFLYNVSPNALVQAPFGPGGSFVQMPNKVPLHIDVFVPIRAETTSFNAGLRYFSGPLKIEGGLRYSMVRGTQSTLIQTTGLLSNTPPTESIPANLQKTSINPWSGGLTLNYEVAPQLNFYASYGHSFRAPTTGVAAPTGLSADLIRTKTEKTDAYEAGFKGTLFNRRLNFAVAAYYQKFDGYLSRFDNIYWTSATDSRGNGRFSFNYNGDAKVKGIEGSLDGRITDNWDIGVAASYAHARYSNAPLPCNDFAGTGKPNEDGPVPKVTGTGNVSYCVSSGRLGQLPDFNLTARTEIRFPMGNVTPFVSALLTHRPGFYYEPVDYHYKSRQLLNMFVGVRGLEDSWELSVFARNLLNQKRITNASLGNATMTSLLDGGVYDSGYRAVNVTNPREFGATVAYRF